MKIAYDIGGCITKFPHEFKQLMIANIIHEQYIISDVHPKEEIIDLLKKDSEDWLHLIPEDNIFSAPYKEHGEACKAILLRELKIDVFYDDFMGYLIWPFPEPAPLRLLVMADPYRPYWHPNFKADGDFGRRVYLG